MTREHYKNIVLGTNTFITVHCMQINGIFASRNLFKVKTCQSALEICHRNTQEINIESCLNASGKLHYQTLPSAAHTSFIL